MGPIFLVLVVVAIVAGLFTGHMREVTQASIESAGAGVTLAIGLIGVMTFWLGLVEVLSRAGLLGSLARGLRPLFRRLFPDVPDGHPALAAMTMNIAANMMGLVNAATPFGIAAMRQLDRLNTRKGTSTDAMCLFLAINTSAVAILPTGVIAARAALGSRDASGIIVTTLLATSLSTLGAILVALVLSRLPFFRKTRPPAPAAVPRQDSLLDEGVAPSESEGPAWVPWRARASLGLAVLAVVGASWGLYHLAGSETDPGQFRLAASSLALPLIILFAVLYGWSREVEVYAAIVEGGKEGFQVAVRIIPYIVAILVAVGMFRASGALDLLIGWLDPVTSRVGMPGEALPMALLRPLSGSGAYAVMAETMKVHGPDSFIGYLVSTMQGSTETTFYVLAVYGGEIGLRRTRHALPACLMGDFFGVAASLAVCRYWLG